MPNEVTAWNAKSNRRILATKSTCLFLRFSVAPIPVIERVHDKTGRRSRWKLLGISPKEFRLIDETKRTVNIQQVRIVVNGVTVLEIIDPSERLAIDVRLPSCVSRSRRSDRMALVVDGVQYRSR